MSDAAAAQVDELLRRGLDAYGQGDVDAAVAAWREALELDPGNADALDYIESAGLRGDEAVAEAAEPDLDATIHEAIDLAEVCSYDPAHALLFEAAATGSIEHAAALDLVRARTIERDRLAIDEEGVAFPAEAAARVQEFDLPSDAGFLLSLVDGMTPVGDLVSLSGMDPCDAFRMLRSLVDSRIIAVRHS